MPRKLSLSRREIVAASTTRGVVVRGTLFSITTSLLPQMGHAKAACVVAKKVASSAVERKRLQRRMRHIMRPLLQQTATPCALIVRALPAAARADFGRIRADLEPLIVRALR